MDSFLRWKKRKKFESSLAQEESKAKRRKDFNSGRAVGTVSGREMFEFNPELVREMEDDDEDGGAVFDSRGLRAADDEEFGGTVRDIDLAEYSVDALAAAAPPTQPKSPPPNNGAEQPAAVEVDENLFCAEDLDDLDDELNDLELEES